MSDIFTPLDIDDQNENEDTNPLEALVGEGKKFSTPEELAAGKLESDRFIGQLQNELAELRKEVSKQMTMDEILTQIRQSSTQVEQQQERQDPPPSNPQSEFSPDKIEELVRQHLTSAQKEALASQNRQKVDEKLKERFGNDAQIYINKKAKELSVSVEYLQNVASENPNVFFRLIQLDAAPQGVPPTAPQSRIMSQPHNSSERNKAYYDNLKAKDRKAYFSPQVQLQLYKDMEKTLKAGGTW